MRFIVVSLANLGASVGEAVTSLRLARAFAELGHDVTLLAPGGHGPHVVDERPARVVASFDLARFGLPNSLNSLPQLFQVLRLLARHEVDVIYSRVAGLTFLFGLCARLFPAVVAVSEHHGWMAAERALSGRRTWLTPIESLLQVLDARLAHRVRTVVPGIKDALVQRGVAPDRVAVVGNACDTEGIRPIARADALVAWGLDPARRYLGFLGSLAAWQGLDSVVRGFADVLAARTDVHFLVAGDGPCRTELEGLAARLDLDGHVTFLGRISHADVATVMGCFDIAVLPTHAGAYAEIGRAPLKLREYAAAGRMVLAARVEAVDAFASEPWVRMFEPGDSRDFARRALELLADAPNHGHAARAYAEAHFAWPVIAREILDGLALDPPDVACAAPPR